LLLAKVCPLRPAEIEGFAVLLLVFDVGLVGGRLPEGPLSTRRKRSLLTVAGADGGENEAAGVENIEGGASWVFGVPGRFRMDRMRLSSSSVGGEGSDAVD
jgi:hypothetical protein